MRLGFWNVGGAGAPMVGIGTKPAELVSWINNHAPDILILEEVSSTLDGVLTHPNYDTPYFVNTLNKNGYPTTKNIVAWWTNAWAGNINWVTQKPIPNQRLVASIRAEAGLISATPQRRNTVCLNTTINGQQHEVWGLHANASSSGGNSALDGFDIQCTDAAERTPIIAGGDFNSVRVVLCDRTVKITPRDHDGTAVQFTQWDKDQKRAQYGQSLRRDGTLTQGPNFDPMAYGAYMAKLNLTRDLDAEVRFTREIKPHRLIDYVLATDSVNIAARNSFVSEIEKFSILKTFDHMPIIYDVT